MFYAILRYSSTLARKGQSTPCRTMPGRRATRPQRDERAFGGGATTNIMIMRMIMIMIMIIHICMIMIIILVVIIIIILLLLIIITMIIIIIIRLIHSNTTIIITVMILIMMIIPTILIMRLIMVLTSSVISLTSVGRESARTLVSYLWKDSVRLDSGKQLSRFDTVRPTFFGRVVARSGPVRFGSAGSVRSLICFCTFRGSGAF